MIFVVGKGGVGKSTTAAELATQSAKAGTATHIISTDPAHSLRDLLPDDIPHLTVEEFDACAYADAWLGRAREALLQVVERGTYLDAADANSFLDLSLPGVDEVMAALRLVELSELTDHLVVDTAPTGHTLRLLDAADLIESWADALEAMVAKADAVALGLVGRSPDWPAGRLMQEWRSQAAAFRDLLRAADFIVVTRNEPVVQAETERLLEQLQARGYKVTTRQIDAPSASRLPQAPALPTSPVHAWIQKSSLSLWLCAGKGGVGKSTCAAAIALARAETGPGCLVSTDPAGSLEDVLQGDPDARLRVWQLDAHAQYERLRARYAAEVKAVFAQLGLSEAIALDRRVIERLWNLAPPGIDEIVALTELLNAAERCAQIVLDSAPTGHFLRLMEMPGIAVDWAHALMRLLLKYKVAGSLENFSREVLEFSQQARALGQQLRDPGKTGVVIVTLEQPVVWAETERLHARLAAAQIPVAAVVINQAKVGQRTPPLPSFLSGVTVIRAPQVDPPPTGAARLRHFLMHWEFAQ